MCEQIGGLIGHCLLFWGPYVIASFKQARLKTQPDPHWQAMQKYKEAPHWWYLVLMVLAFFAGELNGTSSVSSMLTSFDSGLIANLKGDTTLPWWSYIVALASGAFITVHSKFDANVVSPINKASAAFLHAFVRAHGQWCCDQPAIQDDRWCRKVRCVTSYCRAH